MNQTEFSIDQLLIFACRTGEIQLVKERIEKGADVNYLDERYGSPLLAAVGNNKLQVFDYLLSKGANIKIATQYDIGIVEIAIRYGNVDTLKHILDCGANLVNPGKPNYKKMLHNFRATGKLQVD
jgi:ankyrin repeat protein